MSSAIPSCDNSSHFVGTMLKSISVVLKNITSRPRFHWIPRTFTIPSVTFFWVVLCHNIYPLQVVIAEGANSLSSISVVWTSPCIRVKSAPPLEPKDCHPNRIQLECSPLKQLVIKLVMQPGTKGNGRQLVASKLERPKIDKVLRRMWLLKAENEAGIHAHFCATQCDENLCKAWKLESL